MKTLKGWITTSFLAITLIVSTMPANAGVIIGGGDLTTTIDNCTASSTKVGKLDFGVIIGGLTGVIIGGFTGVIFGGGFTDTDTTSTQNCGVIIGG